MLIETYEGRHPAIVSLARFFDYEHLAREDLRQVSRMCSDLAEEMIRHLDGPELTAGLRKLLEAKDCFVRAALGD